MENNSFAFSPGQLNKMLNPKSLSALAALGGIHGIERGLRTDLNAGLSIDEGNLEGTITLDEIINSSPRKTEHSFTRSSSGDGSPGSFNDRIRVFKKNVIPTKQATPLWKLMWIAYNDKVLLLLTAAAVISLALGLYETFAGHREPGEPEALEWVEGVAICVAIVIVVVVGSFNDWQKERAFVKLNTKVRH